MGPIDMLLTDLVMLGGTGVELAQQLTKMHSGTKVLYMSGYAEKAIRQNNQLQQGIAFLGKPFTATALARKVRETLDN